MSLTTLLLFCAVALVAIATPGPTVLLALNNGSRYGLRLSLLGMAGAVASDLVLVAAAGLGLGALLVASEFWFSVVKWLGVAYLCFLGLQMLASSRRAGGAKAAAITADTRRPLPARRGREVFLRSFLVAVTNPKGYLFASAFLPQFIAPTQPQLMQYVILAIAFAGLDFLVMLAYASAGASASRLLRSSAAQWLDRVCGVLMVAAAGTLAVYRRSG